MELIEERLVSENEESCQKYKVEYKQRLERLEKTNSNMESLEKENNQFIDYLQKENRELKKKNDELAETNWNMKYKNSGENLEVCKSTSLRDDNQSQLDHDPITNRFDPISNREENTYSQRSEIRNSGQTREHSKTRNETETFPKRIESSNSRPTREPSNIRNETLRSDENGNPQQNGTKIIICIDSHGNLLEGSKMYQKCEFQ